MFKSSIRSTLTLLTLVAATVFAGGFWQSASAALVQPDLLNGNMDYPTYTVCPGWTFYRDATTRAATSGRETTIVHTAGGAAQRIVYTNGAAGSYAGIYQTIDAYIGDAITFGAWAYPTTAATSQKVSLGVQWDGSTARPATWLAQGTTRTAWNSLQGSGNATATTVTVFLDTARAAGSVAITAYFDDVVDYHAYVPPAPSVFGQTFSSLTVDVDPGDNSTNAAAEFAISIGGDAYTLGTNWVQADGSVGAAPVWQTDAAWASIVVNGLSANTLYSFETQARYSSTIDLATYLSTASASMTLPEPATLALLVMGGLTMLRRRR